jgi:heptosyltransferase-2
MDNTLVHRDCKKFRGDIPCKPHKNTGVKCDNCEEYIKTGKRILIIKFGAIGDVIRTTPIIEKIEKEFPNSEIWWITQYPDILPSSRIDKILTLTAENLVLLDAVSFDMIYSLDKDNFACALANRIKTEEKAGYCLVDSKPAPIDEKARHKYMTGIFDDLNKENTKSYLEEIFEICGFEFSGEEYILDNELDIDWTIKNKDKKIVGLNTGCGDRWTSRLWCENNWIELIKELDKLGYYPMLLGGKQEDEKNKKLAEATGAFYPGCFSLKEFISLMNQCDYVVSAVTMAMHLAIGLKKNLILMNNIFNPHEFELYGRGEIVEPSKPCTCYFSPKCKNKEYFCMDHLAPEDIISAIKRVEKENKK